MTSGDKAVDSAAVIAAGVKETFKKRAVAMARRPNAGPAAREIVNVVEFRLGREHYGLEQKYVDEVQVLKALTPLPGAPPFLRGIINIRGQIISVIDIKRFFELPESGIDDLHMVIVVQAGGIQLGILADAIVGVREMAAAGMQNSLPTLTGIRAYYLKALAEGNVAVLDVSKILTDPSLVVDQGLAKL